MPLYEYSCEDCQTRFERLQKLGDPAPACPSCGGSVRKQFSVPALQFKGSGFYITDYSRGGSKAGGSATGKAQGSAKADVPAQAAAKAEAPAQAAAAGGTTNV